MEENTDSSFDDIVDGIEIGPLTEPILKSPSALTFNEMLSISIAQNRAVRDENIFPLLSYLTNILPATNDSRKIIENMPFHDALKIFEKWFIGNK